MGLTDKQQSLALFISALLITLAGVTYPVTENEWLSLALGIMGAIGFAIKEWAGGKQS